MRRAREDGGMEGTWRKRDREIEEEIQPEYKAEDQTGR